MRTTFDYIVIGGGSAGCVLANRLSADPANSVCLIEAGPPDNSPAIHIPFGIIRLIRNKKYNWCYETEPQPHLNGRRIFTPRGKTLGGSSSINAMCYTRGHRIDYDYWAELGNRGWGYDDLLPYFIKAENFEPGGDPAFHGTGGPLNVANLPSPDPLCEVFIRAAEEVGIPANPDFNGAQQEGVGLYHVTMKNGRRWSTAAAYLRAAQARPNLTVLTEALVTRIEIVDGVATGVEFVRRGQRATLRAHGEVILSAGAINSPQLLMLSGVGPAAELARHGIALKHDLPGVGQNLQDHLDVLIVHKAIRPVGYGFTLRSIGQFLKGVFEYRRRRTGLLTSNSTEAGGFARSRPELSVPDLQFHFTLVKLDEHGKDLRFAIGHGYSLHVCNLRPKSRGYVALADADPLSPPRIQPNYLAHPEDMEQMVAAVKLGRRVLAAKAFAPYRGEEIFPGPQVRSDDEIRDFVRRKADTIYHPVGTSRMGHDAYAVVDDRLRVHGIKNLRVVDASIMPTLVGGNTNAPTVAIAEKAAEMILQARHSLQAEPVV